MVNDPEDDSTNRVCDSIRIDNMGSYQFPVGHPLYSISSTIGTASNTVYTTSVMNGAGWPTSSEKAGLEVKGDANFDGEIKLKGRSLGKILEGIEKRFFILVPDPDKLEQFEALQKAYANYKTLEALCDMPKKDE